MKLVKGRNIDQNKIETLKTGRKFLARELEDEKKATRILTSQLMKDAEPTMEKAHAMILAAKQKETKLENAKMAAKNERTQAVQLERRSSAREKERSECFCCFLGTNTSFSANERISLYSH